MKHLHLFQNEKFTEPYIEFINKNYNPNDHLFLIIGGINEKITPRENVIKLNRSIKSIYILIKKMYTSEKILLHSIFIKQLVLLLFIQPWLLKKSNWIVWGGDLYSYKKRKRSLKSKLYEFLRSIVIKHIGEISTLVKGDFELVKKWYLTNATYYNAVYMNNEQNEYMDKIYNRKCESKSSISIQIGNSADPSNHHIEVIELLKKYDNENIKIYCPLSYGDMEYAKDVIDIGKKVFGEKFIPLEHFMKMNEYMSIMEKVDIGIFNNDRQQALGNILPLLYLGKKVYMRNNTTMWHEFNGDLKLFDINNIKTEKFNDFIKLDRELKELNRKSLESRFDNNAIKKIWDDIFNSSNRSLN
ncbi:TDP-N-acetylfucosamine:lipid II N-acetylfucosaminyltransferase [Peribacillus sp. NPDC055009]